MRLDEVELGFQGHISSAGSARAASLEQQSAFAALY